MISAAIMFVVSRIQLERKKSQDLEWSQQHKSIRESGLAKLEKPEAGIPKARRRRKEKRTIGTIDNGRAMIRGSRSGKRDEHTLEGSV